MNEYIASSPEFHAERTEAYSRVDSETAYILGDFIDHIIDMQDVGCSASSQDDVFSDMLSRPQQ